MSYKNVEISDMVLLYYHIFIHTAKRKIIDAYFCENVKYYFFIENFAERFVFPRRYTKCFFILQNTTIFGLHNI